MQSKTRFFNTTLLRKNITRFWPLWTVYLATWLLALPAILSAEMFGPESTWNNITQPYVAWNIYKMTGGVFGVGMAAAFSCFFAMAMLYYLYTTRSAGFMHSLPIKRGGLFITSYVSGYLFMLVPNAIVLAVTCIVTAVGGFPAFGAILTWFLIISGIELFFYSFALLCGIMTGQIFMLPLLYGILNFLAVGMYYMYIGIAGTFLYGYSAPGYGIWEIFSPALKMADSITANVEWNKAYSTVVSCSLSGSKVAAAYAIAGVVIAIIAYIFSLYRKSETAGDAISFGWARVAFRFGVGFCAAATLGQLFYAVFVTSLAGVDRSLPGMLVCTLAAGAIGYYAALMLTEKSFRVFSHGRMCAAVLAASIIVVCCAFAFDFGGYEKTVPEASDIKSVQVSVAGWNWSRGTVTSGDNVLLATEIHQSMIDQKAEQLAAVGNYPHTKSDDYAAADYKGSISFSYVLKDGATLSRDYSVYLNRAHEDDLSTITGMISEIVNTKEYMTSSTFNGLTPDTITDANLQYVDGENNWQDLNLTKSEWIGVYNAIVADINEGNMKQNELFYKNEVSYSANSASSINFQSENTYVSVSLKPEMINLMNALESEGIFARIDK